MSIGLFQTICFLVILAILIAILCVLTKHVRIFGIANMFFICCILCLFASIILSTIPADIFDKNAKEVKTLDTYYLVKSDYLGTNGKTNSVTVIYEVNDSYLCEDIQHKKIYHDDGPSRIITVRKEWGFLHDTEKKFYINDVETSNPDGGNE